VKRTVFEIFNFKNAVTLKTGVRVRVRVHSRLLKMKVDRSCMVSY